MPRNLIISIMQQPGSERQAAYFKKDLYHMVLYPRLVLYFSIHTVIPRVIWHSTQRWYVTLLRGRPSKERDWVGFPVFRSLVPLTLHSLGRKSFQVENKRASIVVFEFLLWQVRRRKDRHFHKEKEMEVDSNVRNSEDQTYCTNRKVTREANISLLNNWKEEFKTTKRRVKNKCGRHVTVGPFGSFLFFSNAKNSTLKDVVGGVGGLRRISSASSLSAV